MFSLFRFSLLNATVGLCLSLTFPGLYAQQNNETDAFLAAGPLSSSPAMLQKFADAIEARPLPVRAKLPDTSGIPDVSGTTPLGNGDPTADAGVSDEDRDIAQLMAETQWHFEADGTVRTTYWTILHVFSAKAATPASQLVQDWVPLYSDRPEMSARILTDDGREIVNDGSGAFEQAASDGGGLVHTDARRLTLLLDGVEEGALVETKVVSVTRPILDRAQTVTSPLTELAPYRVHRLVITADPGVSPIIRSIGSDLAALESNVETDGSFRVVYQLDDPQPVYVMYEAHYGPDRVPYPMIMGAVPGDWTHLGTTYAASIEQALIEGKEVAKAIAESVPAEVRAGTDRQKIDWCFNRVRQLIRYTGIEFGQQRIIPVSPAVVLARRFGDCKDQSTLLIAILRELGIQANIALLWAGRELDTPADLACFNWFNHAIVYVPSHDLWFDICAEGYPVGILPGIACGRRALICDSERSRLARTPTPSANANVIHQSHEFQVNLSGGGDMRVTSLCAGQSAVGLRLHTGRQTNKEHIEYWKDYFAVQTGLREVHSVKVGDVDDVWHGLTVRSALTQIWSADWEQLLIPWDLQRAVDTLPGALSGYVDSQGQSVDAAQRQSPMHFSVGETYSYEVIVHFPDAMALESLPASFSRTQGLVSVQLQVAVTDRVADASLDSLKELVKPERTVDPAYQAAHNKSFRIRCTRRIEPGTMSAKEANECIEFLKEIRKELSGICVFKWTAFTEYYAQPSNEKFRSLVEQSKRSSVLVDPMLVVAFELHAAGLVEFARQQAKQIADTNGILRLSRNWIAVIQATGDDGRVLSMPDYSGIREFNRNRELLLDLPQRRMVLQSATLEPNGLRSTSPDRIRDAAGLLQLCQTDSAVTEQDFRLLSVERLLQGLALDDASATKAALAGLGADRPVAGVFEDLFSGASHTFPKAMPPESVANILRMCWELCVTAERFDLAFKLQGLYDSSMFKLPLAADVAPTLAALLPTEPESVARHFFRNMLAVDTPALEKLVLPGTNVSKLMHPRTIVPLSLQRWFAIERVLSTLTLVDSIVALMPVELIEHGKFGMEVVFENPYVDDPQAQMRMLLVKDPVSNEWLAAPQEDYIAKHLLRMLDMGETEGVEVLLNYLLPPPKGLLGWFEDEANRPQIRRLFYKIDCAAEYRLPLVTRALVSETENEIASFDQWLSSAKLELPKNQLSLVNDFREGMFRQMRDFQRGYEHSLREVEKRATWAAIASLEGVVLQDKLNGGDLYLDPRWRPLVEAYLESSQQREGEQNGLDRLARVEFELIEENNEQAFELLKELLRSDSAKALAIPNKYLWKSLLVGEDKETLQERYDEVLKRFPLTGQEDSFYLHTLACVEIQLGRVYEAMSKMETLTVLAAHEPELGNNFVRAMLLEELGFEEAAEDYYQRGIHAKPFSESSVIARRKLAELGNTPPLPASHP